jgi:hypothetical protein
MSHPQDPPPEQPPPDPAAVKLELVKPDELAPDDDAHRAPDGYWLTDAGNAARLVDLAAELMAS